MNCWKNRRQITPLVSCSCGKLVTVPVFNKHKRGQSITHNKIIKRVPGSNYGWLKYNKDDG